MQPYQRFQCIGHTDFKDLSSAVANTPSLLPSMGKTGLGAIVCKTAHVRFHGQKRVHTRLSEKERTHTRLHAETRAVSDGGRYLHPRTVPHVRKPPRAGYQKGVLCRFWALAEGAPEERREPAEQRCAYARRCPKGVAAPPGCVIFFAFVKIGICTSCAQGLSACARQGGITTLGTLCMFSKRWTAACQKGLFAVF